MIPFDSNDPPKRFFKGEYIEYTEDEWNAWQAEIEPDTSAKTQKINEEFDAEVSQITAGYSQSEIDSWPEQLKEAEAWTADNSASTPLVDAAIAQNNRTKAEHIGKILTNAGLYKVAFGGALGRKQKKIADLQ